MHARAVLGMGKGVLFREVSSSLGLVEGEVLLYHIHCCMINPRRACARGLR